MIGKEGISLKTINTAYSGDSCTRLQTKLYIRPYNSLMWICSFCIKMIQSFR